MRCLVDTVLHRLGDLVSIHDHFAFYVSRGTSCGLSERSGITQEALFVGIQDGHQAYFGQVESLAQQVDTHQHIIQSFAQILHDLDTLDGVDV